jgi:hypothetical protein
MRLHGMADTSPSRISCFSKYSIGLAFSRQQGMTLIMLVFIVGLTATAYLVYALNSNTIKIERDKKTATALADAKTALIGWSAGNATMPGALPCPDTNNSGSATTSGQNCIVYIGRLPWKQIGMGDMRDGNGECLWYALSPVFRNAISVGNRGVSQPVLNSTSSGSITLLDANATAFPTPVNPVIAIIFAPGVPLAGQDHSNVGSTVCGGNTTASNYLDTAQGIDNSTGNYVSGNNYTFIAGTASNTFNDRLIYITVEDLFSPVRKRIADELAGVGTPPITGLRKYYADNRFYPWAGDASGNVVTNAASGYAPYNALTLTPSSLRSWMVNNGWMSLVTYQTGTNFNPNTSFPQQCTAGNCITVRGIDVPASITVGGGSSTWTSRVCETNTIMTSCPLR